MIITVNEAIEDIKSIKATGMVCLDMSIEALEALKKIRDILDKPIHPEDAIHEIEGVMPEFVR